MAVKDCIDKVILNLAILLISGSMALSTVAKAACNGVVDTLAIVTASNAVQTISFILYKSYRQRSSMLQLEEKLQKLREDRAQGWESWEKLHELRLHVDSRRPRC
mmetsp:Transcript_4946/g.10917  ORF Transcript_4946/g.10917 Transcript_4946/m.10917 type:complete len:105 (-) Transcript_4946:722-1036(-)